MKKVQVLMSTYNGADYIAEQIESIFSQNGQNEEFATELLIRDDGSTDDTISIIQEYSNKFPIKILKSEKSVGFKNSFFELVDKAEKADYYFFSDQDDIWKENKIKRFIEVFRDDISYMVFSDLTMFGNEQGSLYKRMRLDNSNLTYKHMMLSERVTGASSAINYAALCVIKQSSLSLKNKIDYHDKLIGMMIPLVGEFTYLPEQLTKYRRHSNNVTVQSVNSSSWFERRFAALKDPLRDPTIMSIVIKLSTLAELEKTLKYQKIDIKEERIDFLNRIIKFSGRSYIGQIIFCLEFFNVVTARRTGKNVWVIKFGVFYALLRGAFLNR
ncbi:glycosyltransferase [Leuconostoc lactis]|uniref:glycosyltransferase n=1 Tax=Leuconostoc lactis TaxID=1246 RepID=UPI00241F2F81|nr:glycosyltransferase [Leuconostoc lactis]